MSLSRGFFPTELYSTLAASPAQMVQFSFSSEASHFATTFWRFKKNGFCLGQIWDLRRHIVKRISSPWQWRAPYFWISVLHICVNLGTPGNASYLTPGHQHVCNMIGTILITATMVRIDSFFTDNKFRPTTFVTKSFREYFGNIAVGWKLHFWSELLWHLAAGSDSSDLWHLTELKRSDWLNI
jgi:hypothetical protein